MLKARTTRKENTSGHTLPLVAAASSSSSSSSETLSHRHKKGVVFTKFNLRSPYLINLVCFMVGLTISRIYSLHHHQQTRNKEVIQELPLLIFPLLKELRAGWSNMQPSPLIQRNAHGTHNLIIDVGLDSGSEFFQGIDNGFEVVGFEPNPKSFPRLAKRCRKVHANNNSHAHTNCKVINRSKLHAMKDQHQLTLKRKTNTSYLINAAAGGQEWQTLQFHMNGAVSSFSAPSKSNQTDEWETVQTVPIDDIIQEDVYLFKIDTQGFDPYVLQGSQQLFHDHVVRELIFEVEPMQMHNNHLSIIDTMQMVQNKYGMVCFTARTDLPKVCSTTGDSGGTQLSDSLQDFEAQFFQYNNVKPRDNGYEWSHCWEDFVCVNTHKAYPKPLPTALKKRGGMKKGKKEEEDEEDEEEEEEDSECGRKLMT